MAATISAIRDFFLCGVYQEPTIAEKVNHYFNQFNEGIPPEMHVLSHPGDIAALVWDQHPHYVIKVPVVTKLPTVAYYYVGREGKRRRVEENSLQLRVPTAARIAQIIKDENLYLLHVPKKWSFSRGIIAEKLDLLSWDETEREIKSMPRVQQIEYITQLWRVIYLTGNQDLSRNIRLLPDRRLALFDTEPYGTSLEKVEDLLPRATTNFLNERLFDRHLKLEIIKRPI